MPIMVQWNVTFLLGIEEIDQHHKHLVELLNLTYDEHKRGAPAESLRATVEELVDYSNYHFGCEERWMTETAYPELLSHRQEHEIFSSRVRELRNSCILSSNTALDVVSFLSNWFSYHILGTDMKFGRFVEAQNLGRRIRSMKPAV